MSSHHERHRRALAVFNLVSPLTSDQRRAALARECGLDRDLRLRVEEMLAAAARRAESARTTTGGPPPKPSTPANADATAEIQRRLASRTKSHERYERKGELARGAQGVVLHVWDQDLRRNLAMKLVGGDGPSGGPGSSIDARALDRFLEEAQVTGQLDHPGIVPVHELGLDAQRRLYFTMKLVKGQDFDKVIELVRNGQEGWTLARALNVLSRVCEAMAYAHSKNVIHRDLKPANIMVGRFGEVYVMDWGLAKVLDAPPRGGSDKGANESVSAILTDRRKGRHDPMAATAEGVVMGTPGYMSPEQASGKLAALGPASDVYSLGAILYHLLAGHMPYVPPGSRRNALAVLAQVREGPPPPIAQVAPRAPKELAAICAKAMAREPYERYLDTQRMADDLSAYLEGRVEGQRRAGAWASVARWTRRRKSLAATVAAIVVILAAGFATNIAFGQPADASHAAAQPRVTDLLVEMDTLWPAHPDLIERYEAWLARARAEVATLPAQRARLAELRATALPRTDDERRADRESHPDFPTLQALLTMLETRTNATDRPEGSAPAERRAQLELRVAERRSWRFPSSAPDARWQHDRLAALVRDLEALHAGLDAEGSEAFGGSVPARLARAKELARQFGADGEHGRAWAAARSAITKAYPDLVWAPQMGLVPLGPDPDSGRWEFGDLMTGRAPARGSDGRLVLSDESGVVFVLLPGGVFAMGEPTSAAIDTNQHLRTAPVHEVRLPPFLVAKHEMTRGQWRRATGRDPTARSSTAGPSHPVVDVSWDECAQVCTRLGFSLPTEAQWEYAARAGTTSAWWSGSEAGSLAGVANFADEEPARRPVDGRTLPVGRLRANPFGLHDVHGNVREWCLDPPLPYPDQASLARLGDLAEQDHRVIRGGSVLSAAAATRSACREHAPRAYRQQDLGLRPVRPVR